MILGLTSITCGFHNSNPCTSGQLYHETNTTLFPFRWTRIEGSTPTAQTGPNGDQSGSGGYMYIEVTDVVSTVISLVFNHWVRRRLLTQTSEKSITNT